MFSLWSDITGIILTSGPEFPGERGPGTLHRIGEMKAAEFAPAVPVPPDAPLPDNQHFVG